MDHSSCLELDDGAREERSKKEISHRKARHRPRFALRGWAGTSPTSPLLVVVRENVARTSGRSACPLACRASEVLHESPQHPRAHSSLPSPGSTRWILQRSSACENRLSRSSALA